MGGREKAAEQSHQYNVVRWLGYLHMLVIIPGKLREARYKQLKASQFVSLISRTKAIETILMPKSPYLLSSTPFCDVSLVMWTTTKEKWAVYVVTSLPRGRFPNQNYVSCHILYCGNSRELWGSLPIITFWPGLQSSVGVACRHRLLHNPMPFIPAILHLINIVVALSCIIIIPAMGAHTMDRDNTM